MYVQGLLAAKSKQHKKDVQKDLQPHMLLLCFIFAHNIKCAAVCCTLVPVSLCAVFHNSALLLQQAGEKYYFFRALWLICSNKLSLSPFLLLFPRILTDLFTISEPSNPLIDVSELHKVRRLKDCGALKL